MHVSSSDNGIAYSVSRKRWQRFKSLVPEADAQPTPISTAFWNILEAKLTV